MLFSYLICSLDFTQQSIVTIKQTKWMVSDSQYGIKSNPRALIAGHRGVYYRLNFFHNLECLLVTDTIYFIIVALISIVLFN